MFRFSQPRILHCLETKERREKAELARKTKDLKKELVATRKAYARLKKALTGNFEDTKPTWRK